MREGTLSGGAKVVKRAGVGEIIRGAVKLSVGQGSHQGEGTSSEGRDVVRRWGCRQGAGML